MPPATKTVASGSRLALAPLRFSFMMGSAIVQGRSDRVPKFILREEAALQGRATDYEHGAIGKEDISMVRAMLDHVLSRRENLPDRVIEIDLVLRTGAGKPAGHDDPTVEQQGGVVIRTGNAHRS